MPVPEEHPGAGNVEEKSIADERPSPHAAATRPRSTATEESNAELIIASDAADPGSFPYRR
jgi:hypothetical protein